MKPILALVRLCGQLALRRRHFRAARCLSDRAISACARPDVDRESALEVLSSDTWLNDLSFWTPATALCWAKVSRQIWEISSSSTSEQLLPDLCRWTNQVFWSVWSLPLSRRDRHRFLINWWAEIGILVDVKDSVPLIELLVQHLPVCNFHLGGHAADALVFCNMRPRPKKYVGLIFLLAHAFYEDNVVLWDALCAGNEKLVCAFLVDRPLLRSVLMAHFPWCGYAASSSWISRKNVLHRLIDPAAPWNAPEYIAVPMLRQTETSERYSCESPIYQVAHLAMVHQDESLWDNLVCTFPIGTEPFWPLFASELVYSGLADATRMVNVIRWLRRPDPFWSRMDSVVFARYLMDKGRFHSSIFRAVNVPDVLSLIPSLTANMSDLNSRVLFRQELIRLALGAAPVNTTNHWPEHIRLAYLGANERMAADLLSDLANDAELDDLLETSFPFESASGSDQIPLFRTDVASQHSSLFPPPDRLLYLPPRRCPVWTRFLFRLQPDGQAVLTDWAAFLSRHWVLERLILDEGAVSNARPPALVPPRLM